MISKIHPVFFRFNNKPNGPDPMNFYKNYNSNFFSIFNYARDLKISFLLKHFFIKEHLFVTFIRIEINSNKTISINMFLNQNYFLKIFKNKIKNYKIMFLLNRRNIHIKKINISKKRKLANKKFVRAQINIFKSMFISFKQTTNYYNNILLFILKMIRIKLINFEIKTFNKFCKIYKHKILLFKKNMLIKYVYKLYMYFYKKIIKIFEYQKYKFIKILQNCLKSFLTSSSFKTLKENTVLKHYTLKTNLLLLNFFSKSQKFLFSYVKSIHNNYLNNNKKQKIKLYRYLPKMLKTINLCAKSFKFPKYSLRVLRKYSILQIKTPILKSITKLKNIEYLNKYNYKLCLKIFKSNILSPEYINSCMIEGISKKVKARVILKNMYNYLSKNIFEAGIKQGISIKGFKIHIKGRIMNAPRTKHLRMECNTLNLATVNTQLLYDKQYAKSHFGAYTVKTWIQYSNL